MDNDYPVSALVERLYVGLFIAHYIRRELRCRYLDRVAVVTRHRHRGFMDNPDCIDYGQRVFNQGIPHPCATKPGEMSA